MFITMQNNAMQAQPVSTFAAMLLWRAKSYLRYLMTAQNRHGTHSPFVYRLLDEVIYDHAPKSGYAFPEQLRKELMKDGRSIAITDLGAGSNISSNKFRTVASIARNSAKQPRYGRLLYRLAQEFRPKEMIELGTSLGVSALYQALANPTGRLTTFEGCPQTAAIARDNFEKAAATNIQLLEGNFDDRLQPHLDRLERLDWAFIDGNHRSAPTLHYFRKCLEKSHSGTVLIFDDIHWSPDMATAWDTIKAHPRVSVTLDLFQIGIVFLREGQAKQDFVIRY
jgi:predicted O-methyltransferase YrrM